MSDDLEHGDKEEHVSDPVRLVLPRSTTGRQTRSSTEPAGPDASSGAIRQDDGGLCRARAIGADAENVTASQREDTPNQDAVDGFPT